MPGLAFLWFIGVVRDRIGGAEDRFFATVFLGTGLLFVAMLFAAGAVSGGLLAAEAQRGSATVSPEVWHFGRHVTYLVLTVYAMRMAGAFTIVTTTIAVRVHIFPRWLALFGWLAGVVLLLTIESFAWVEVLFPLWVLVLSIYMLVRPRLNADESKRRSVATSADTHLPLPLRRTAYPLTTRRTLHGGGHRLARFGVSNDEGLLAAHIVVRSARHLTGTQLEPMR